MSGLTLYIKPTCSTCRNAIAFLQERGVAFREVRYYDEPLDAERLNGLIDKAGGDITPFVRTKAQQYKHRGLDAPGVSRSQIIEAMAQEPDLIQRPIAELDGRAIVARPVETLEELL